VSARTRDKQFLSSHLIRTYLPSSSRPLTGAVYRDNNYALYYDLLNKKQLYDARA